MKKIKIEKSEKLWQKARKIIPSATQTISKGADQFVRGVTPFFLSRGRGAYIWDLDGNKYIDYPMALGPIILGHADPDITKTVSKQIELGTTYTLPHPLEVELAEMLTKIIPCAEMVRFGKNGSDVTTAAIRLARAYTGRQKIAYCGYHGWQDWYVGVTNRPAGIPESFRKILFEFKYNDPSSLEKIFKENPGEIAAVIMEQPVTEPKNKFLHKTVSLAHKNGALFILDEIVTGFRYAMGGAQEYYKVMPDLACFGKAMANGFPLAVLTGKKKYMQLIEKDVFFSMTFGGETASIRAAIETIKKIKSKKVISQIWQMGKLLRTGIEKAIRQNNVPVILHGNPPRSVLAFSDKNGQSANLIRSLFLQETLKRGVLFGVPIFISYSHTEKEVKKTIAVCTQVFALINKAINEKRVNSLLQGQPIGQQVRKHLS